MFPGKLQQRQLHGTTQTETTTGVQYVSVVSNVRKYELKVCFLLVITTFGDCD